jgi:REP element-mobilizing transposase RayT
VKPAFPIARDPVTGVIPREKFQAIIGLPFGEAVKVIRKYDPLWGRVTGEKIRWKVRFRRQVWEEGYAIVEAVTEKEAEKLADKITDAQISWDVSDDIGDIEIESIEPKS